MKNQEGAEHTTNASREEPEQERERTTAPPIEREHETYAGVFEEDERRDRARTAIEDW